MKAIRNITLQEFNDVKVNRITTARVEKYITNRQKQDMNISTIRKVLVSLNQIMAYAVRHRYIDHNPVRDCRETEGYRAGLKGRKSAY